MPWAKENGNIFLDQNPNNHVHASHMIKQKKIKDWIGFTLMFVILIKYHQQWNKMVVNLAPLQVFFALASSIIQPNHCKFDDS
jgi:hypothetical protein